MGTPAFACPSLDALIARPDPVVGVVCQPDRPRGRGLARTAPPVKQLALAHGLPVLQPETLRDPSVEPALRAWCPDLIVVAAYGRILRRSLLDLPPHGCINVHASLLPRHRGAAPIQWSILSGDTETGVSIMAMNEEMDAGDVFLTRRTPITPDDTAETLTSRLATLGAEALVAALDGLHAGTLRPTPQPAEGITFAPRIEREHARIDWSRAAVEIERAIRAFSPSPGAYTSLDGRTLKVSRARVESGAPGGPPGTVVRADAVGLEVATGAGRLSLLDVQLEGRKRLPAAAFLAGSPIRPGTCLGS